jgi:hypothetical protein
LRHVKEPFIDVEFAFVGKINRSFLAHSPLSLLEVSRVVVGVKTSGGASENFQIPAKYNKRTRLHTSGGTSYRGPMEEEENTSIFFYYLSKFLL